MSPVAQAKADLVVCARNYRKYRLEANEVRKSMGKVATNEEERALGLEQKWHRMLTDAAMKLGDAYSDLAARDGRRRENRR